MQILIVEDDKFSVKVLVDLLQENEVNAQITVAGSLKETRKYISSKKYDLIFLDVHLQDGLSTNMVNELPANQKVIFITGDPAFAIQAFEYNAVDYLVKPVDKKRFEKTIARLKESDEKEQNIVIKADYQFYKVKLSDIKYVKTNGDYLTVTTENESYTFYGRLKNFIEKLPTETFIQCHRSYIVNMDKITGIDNNKLMIGDVELPVSASYKKEVVGLVKNL